MTGESASADREVDSLRRVATLVAQGVPPAEIFSAVSDEVEGLFGCSALVMKFDSDLPGVVFTGVSKGFDAVVGSRWEFQDGMAAAEVYRTGQSARVDELDWSTRQGPFAAEGQRLGVVSAVASPIVVQGRVWGAMALASSDRVLPLDTEARLEKFTELIESAIANAEARDALESLIEEQAALRRVATLVARGVPAAEVFQAVSEEVASLFGENLAGVGRLDVDGSAVTLVGFAQPLEGVEIGMRVEVSDETPAGRVIATGRSARVDSANLAAATEFARRLSIVSSVSSPIIVEGKLWGTISALSTANLLPPDAEGRLERFGEFVAMAIANADSREAVRLLADEQAALRRVATLVARGVPAGEVFQAVSEEVASVFGESLAAVGRSEADGSMVTIVGIATQVEGLEVGTRVHIHEETPTGMAFATGRSARVDREDWSEAVSVLGHIAHHLGVTSWVTCPVVVESRLWGYLSVAARQPLPPETEQRLEKFSELVGTAIANAESTSELAASRLRIVTASDEARRRIERDLHDGTQQRLVALGLAVRAVDAGAPANRTDLHSELSQIAAGLVEATTELQEISRGIHPANLSQSGLGAALRTLGRRSPIPFDLEVTIEGRLPEPIEVAAYYVTSEALANTAKHAQASRVEVSLKTRDNAAFLSIRDDGIGGADPARGSGLVGLVDRVEALGGTIDIQSTSGDGTCITTMLPLAAEPHPYSSH